MSRFNPNATDSSSGPICPDQFVSGSENYIALTIDDGPAPGFADSLLQCLADHEVRATFFPITARPSSAVAVRNYVRWGHAVGIHGHTHRALTNLPPMDQETEIRTSIDVLGDGLTCRVLRPPYGEYSADTLAIAKRLGLSIVLWSLNTKDWRNPGADWIHDHIVKLVHPGAVILMHEGRPDSFAALPRIINSLRADNYRFVTLSQWLALSQSRLGSPSGNGSRGA